MIKYLSSNDKDCGRGRYFKFDNEKELISELSTTYPDYVWFIPEDGEFKYVDVDGTTKIRNVKTGDVVLRMYSSREETEKREYFFVQDEGLKAYYRRRIELAKKHLDMQSDEKKGCDCVPESEPSDY